MFPRTDGIGTRQNYEVAPRLVSPLARESVLLMKLLLYIKCRSVLGSAENVSCRGLEDEMRYSSLLTLLERC